MNLVLIRIAAAGAALLAALWLWNSFVDRQQQIGYDRAAGEYQVKLAEAKDEARATENRWQDRWQGANNERTELEKRLEASRTAAAAADDRLRRAADDFGQRLSVATIEACRTAAETAAGLLGECSRQYRDVAAAADGHLADLAQCEAAWPE